MVTNMKKFGFGGVFECQLKSVRYFQVVEEDYLSECCGHCIEFFIYRKCHTEVNDIASNISYIDNSLILDLRPPLSKNQFSNFQLSNKIYLSEISELCP